MTGGQLPRTAPSPQSRRLYGGTVLLGVASATAVAVGVSQPWIRGTASVAGLPRIEVTVTGADLAPLAGALGLVLLAAFGAVLATRGRARQGVGLLIVAGAAVVVAAAAHPADASVILSDRLAAKGWSPAAGYSASTQAWRWLVLAGAAACLCAGMLVVSRGASWPTMGRRYDAPETVAPSARAGSELGESDVVDEEALWRALDEGRDPTREPSQAQDTMDARFE